MKYLYTGWMPSFGSDTARFRSLVSLGRDVVALSFIPDISRFGPKVAALESRLRVGPGIWTYNLRLLTLARRVRPDVVWVDKGELVMASTLRAIRRSTGAFLVCYNTDDVEYAGNGWRLHLRGIPEYHCYFTTNRLNVSTLKSLGASWVELTQLGYHRDLIRPVHVAEEEARRLGAEVGFIGHWEPATEDLMVRLVELGLPMRVRGTSWHKLRHRRQLGSHVEAVAVLLEDYVKAIVATKINLGIPSAHNRNESSGRSFEIPAAGGFLLAKRTREHQQFYEEGKEAEFFGSPEELVAKARYYLEHEEERHAIASAGYRRCISSGYSYQELMAGLVEMVERACRGTGQLR